jgi:hypothetical protein
MININDSQDIFFVKSDCFEAILSKRKGGSMRSLVIDGIDTGLKREGCEYWVNSKEHYEQEFGQILNFHVSRISEHEISLVIRATLVSPKEKTLGGECDVVWSFQDNGLIVTKSRIVPVFSCLYYDQYVCFDPLKFKDFRVIGNTEYKKIGKPLSTETWWREMNTAIPGVSIKNDALALNIAFDEKMTIAGVYTSRSMLEIKFQDSKPRYDEFCTMSINGNKI